MRPTTPRTPATLLALLALLLVAGCETLRAPAPVSEAAATVDGRVIPISTLESFLHAQLVGAGMDPEVTPDQHAQVDEMQRDILGQLIHDELIAGAADELGVTVSEEEVDEQLEALAAQFGGTEPLLDELEQRGLTEEDLRAQLAAFVRQEALTTHFAQAAEIDDAELEAAYEERLESRYRVARAAHILVEAEEEAESLLAELEEGADFAALAEEHSADEVSAERGGDLGENPRGAYVEEFDDAVWVAEEGELVGPVETDFGYHIIRVEEFRDTPLEEVEDELREELGGQEGREAYEAWLDEVFAAAEVWVNPRFGEWDAELGAVVPREPLEREPAEEPDDLADLDDLELDDVEP